MTIDRAFGSVVRDLRKRYKVTQTELGERVGLSRQGIWEIERAHGSTRLEIAYQVSLAFDMPIEELMRRVRIRHHEKLED